MGKRWVSFLIVLVLLLPLFATAHKNPVVEYAYVGHLWEEAYHTVPRQPVVGEYILFELSVEHPSDVIEGEVTGIISIYRDDTRWEWYGGESYKRPDWLIMKEANLIPAQSEDAQLRSFTQDVVIEQAGSYVVTIDWYQDGQYIGQSMHTLDIEQRTVGPLYLWFSGLILVAVLIGVRRGVL